MKWAHLVSFFSHLISSLLKIHAKSTESGTKSSSLLIKKKLFHTLVSFFHKIKHIFMFFNNEICYLNHDTKHFFFFLQTPKIRFSTILFKSQFSHPFKQQFLNSMTKRALNYCIKPFLSQKSSFPLAF